MMTAPNGPDSGDSATRIRIEALIGAYPNITAEELSRLVHWLRREATSYDVAMLSARDDIRQGYEQFKKDHIDRVSPSSIAVIIITILILVGAICWFL